MVPARFDGNHDVRDIRSIDKKAIERPIITVTDSDSARTNIESDTNQVTGKRLGVVVSALRQAYDPDPENEIYENATLMFAPTEFQLADGLTKEMKQDVFYAAMAATSSLAEVLVGPPEVFG